MTKNGPGAEELSAPVGIAAAERATTAQPDLVGGVADNGMPITGEPQQPVSRGYIFWLMIASFGASMAMMVPLSYGIAVRITELAPGHEEVLGYITGTAQLVYLLVSPIIGIWSDRTRSRFGRRTPFIFLGTPSASPDSSSSASPRTCSSWGRLGRSAWSAGRSPAPAIQTLQADSSPSSSADGLGADRRS